MFSDNDLDDLSSEYFINHIDDTPELDMTVRVATPVEPGGLRVPTPTWRTKLLTDDSAETIHRKNRRSHSTPSSPTTFNTPNFQRKASVPVMQLTNERSNGNMGLFYRRSATPNDQGQALGKVQNLRRQFEKIEREKIERQLQLEAAARGADGEMVPIFV